MTTSIIEREEILPFQSRLFKSPGVPVIAEISEFQAQSWGLGGGAVNFHVALCAGDLGRRVPSHFARQSSERSSEGAEKPHLLAEPAFIGQDQKLSIVAAPLNDPKVMNPFGAVTLSIGLRKSSGLRAVWTLSLRIEEVLVESEAELPAQEMLCASVADLIYDELMSLNRQAASLSIDAPVSIRLVHDASVTSMRLFVARLRSECETIRHLINGITDEKKSPGIKVVRSLSVAS